MKRNWLTNKKIRICLPIISILISVVSSLTGVFLFSRVDACCSTISDRISYLPTQRALGRFEDNSLVSSSFDSYRQEVFYNSKGFCNAFRLTQSEDVKISVSGVQLSDSVSLIDWKCLATNHRTDSLLFSSFGDLPPSFDNPSLVIDTGFAQSILHTIGRADNDYNSLVSEHRQITFSFGDNQIELPVAAIYYHGSGHDYSAVANEFYNTNFGSCVFLPSEAFDSLNFPSITYFFSLYANSNMAKTTLKYSLQIVNSKLSNVSFPDTKGNQEPDSSTLGSCLSRIDGISSSPWFVTLGVFLLFISLALMLAVLYMAFLLLSISTFSFAKDGPFMLMFPMIQIITLIVFRFSSEIGRAHV